MFSFIGGVPGADSVFESGSGEDSFVCGSSVEEGLPGTCSFEDVFLWYSTAWSAAGLSSGTGFCSTWMDSFGIAAAASCFDGSTAEGSLELFSTTAKSPEDSLVSGWETSPRDSGVSVWTGFDFLTTMTDPVIFLPDTPCIVIVEPLISFSALLLKTGSASFTFGFALFLSFSCSFVFSTDRFFLGETMSLFFTNPAISPDPESSFFIIPCVILQNLFLYIP